MPCRSMPSRSWKWRGSARAAVLAVEDNYVGGLGSELAEASAALAAPVTVESLGVRRIPKSGRTADDVLDYVGLSVPEIAAAAERLARSVGERTSSEPWT